MLKDVTNEVFLAALRTATEIVEELDIKEVDSSIMHFDEETKRFILSQKLAREIIATMNEHIDEEGG